MKKLQLTKGKIFFMAITALFLAIAAFFLFPRDLGELISCPNSSGGIVITEYNKDEVVTLTGEDAAEMLNVIKKTKVYLNPFFTKSDEGGSNTIGMNIKIEPKHTAGTKSPMKIGVFTDDILVIDGVQYKLYGNEFIETFRTFIN